MKLHELEITEEQAKKYFPELDEKGKPLIKVTTYNSFGKKTVLVKVTTYNSFGKKTVLGVFISVARVEQCDGYAMEYSTMSPCVRIPLATPMSTNRKNFQTEVKEACKRWLFESSLGLKHPYRKAIEQFIGVA